MAPQVKQTVFLSGGPLAKSLILNGLLKSGRGRNLRVSPCFIWPANPHSASTHRCRTSLRAADPVLAMDRIGLESAV